MRVSTVEKTQFGNKQRSNSSKFALTTAAGAAIGAGARYLLPTKEQMKTMFSKESVDSFVHSANKRGAERSILKYTAAGAMIAAGLNLIAKAFAKNNGDNKEFDFTKYEALHDTPADSAYAIMWYGD